MSAEPQSTPVRRQVVYHGRVQGVFFRATAHQLSRNYQVIGYVRNLPDGTVELEAEGPASEVDRYLMAVTAEYERYITHADTRDVSPRGDEGGFQIRY